MSKEKEVKLSKDDEKKLQKMLQSYVDVQAEYSRLNERCVNGKNKLVKRFKDLNLKTYHFEDEKTSKLFRISRTERTSKITFDTEAIEGVLDKKTFNEICDKKYEITDFEGFAKVLKKHGIKFGEVSPYINVTKQINAKKMDTLYKKGEIELTCLSGLFSLDTIEYISFKEIVD